MEEPKSIKILEVCKVEPNAAPSNFSLPLTFFDMIWPQVTPTPYLLFYKIPQEKYDSSILLIRLKRSLSLTLQYYFPLAGKLTWPLDSETPVIQYETGDGVSLTIAETQSNFNTLSGDQFRGSDVLRSLLPNFPTSKTQSPPIAIQVTLFPYSGFCIGFVSEHIFMDAKSISMFLHSWAYINKIGDKAILPLELVPYFDRDLVKKQQEEFDRAYPGTFGKKVDPENRALTIHDMSPTPDMMIGTFILTRENINTLKESVLAYWGKKHKLGTTPRVSSFVVSTAYAMVCLIKVQKLEVEKALIRVTVNARARMDLPLSPNYFGNCLLFCLGLENMDELLSQNGFFYAVEAITRAKSQLSEGPLKLGAKLKDLLTSAPKELAGYVVASSLQFGLYKTDFGWGKPDKIDLLSIDRGLTFHLCDDRDENGGVEIGVALKKHEREAFASVFKSEINACKSLYSRM